MNKAKAKTKTKTTPAKRRAGAGKTRKAVDLHALRNRISNLVGGQAVRMVGLTIAEVEKGHYGAMKYLFEMIGLYPGADGEAPAQGEDVLAKTLLTRLGLPEDTAPKPAVTKDSAASEAQSDAVE